MNMAEEDDDDSFGDFTFASTTLASSNTTGDDEWGDFNFIQSPIQNNINSPPPQPQPQPQPQTQWVKINGALPLSLFGDEDEDEEEKTKPTDPPVDPVTGDAKDSFPTAAGNIINMKSRENSEFNSNNSNAHLGINDLVVNLYGQRQQQITRAADNGNESGLDFAATNSSVLKLNSNSSAENGPFRYEMQRSVSESDPLNSSLKTVNAQESDEDDDQGWEFRDAYTDLKTATNGNDNKEFPEETVSPLGLLDGSHGSIDPFAPPINGIPDESHKMDNGFDSKPITKVENGFSLDLKTELSGTGYGLSLNTHGESVDSDELFGDFETAFTEESSKGTMFPPGSRNNVESATSIFAESNEVFGESLKMDNEFNFNQSTVVQDVTSPELDVQTEHEHIKNGSNHPHAENVDSDEKFGEFDAAHSEAGHQKGNEASPVNRRAAVPLSIFGIEVPEADNSLNLRHDLAFNISTHEKTIPNQSPKLSINDLLSDLYSQAQPTCSIDNEHSPSGKEYELHSSDREHNSWEFKDAFFQTRVENENISFDKKLNNCMEFFSNLKDELFVVARSHLCSLKKAQSTAPLDCDATKVAALDEEIQAFEELQQENKISKEAQSDDHPERNICLKQYIETLHGPNFQALESEYHISRRLSLAELELGAANDLIKHFTAMLNILKLAPKEDPADYVSAWFKMISVCAQELKHGSWIWKQSLEENVRSEIFSEPRGKQFISALGEIYRAVVIFEASAKIYKPWILLSLADLSGMHALLDECHSIWSTSGLKESIPNIESLLESITHIRELDAVTLANKVLSQDESLCRLSLLPLGVVPEMKMVIWNGEKYFVTLANLWANLVSSDPPTFRSIHG